MKIFIKYMPGVCMYLFLLLGIFCSPVELVYGEAVVSEQKSIWEAGSIYDKENFILSINADREEVSAGGIVVYSMQLQNLTEDQLNLTLTTVFSRDGLEGMWMDSAGNSVGMSGQALPLALAAGERRSFYMNFVVPEEETEPMELSASITAESETYLIRREADACVTIHPLKLDFEVVKTADTTVATPGNSVGYQIRIFNTGERALHSILSTERFQAEDIRATFLPQEGVQLSKDGTHAYIAMLEPGAEVTLHARVELPEQMSHQELVNQVLVVTEETGARETISEAVIEVVLPDPIPEKDSGDKGDGGQENVLQQENSGSVFSVQGLDQEAFRTPDPVRTEDDSPVTGWLSLFVAALLLIVLIRLALVQRRGKSGAFH